jgi:segregation and condensation protein B
MPSPARAHHLAPIEDLPMEETEAQISEAQVSVEETSVVEQEDTSAVEQNVTESEPEAVAAGEEEVTAELVEEISSLDEEARSTDESVADAGEAMAEVASADVASEETSDDAPPSADETVSVDQAASVDDEPSAADEAPSVEEATSVADGAASVEETASVDEAPSVADESAPVEAVSVVDEAPAIDPGARPEELRLLEAMLFAATEPLDEPSLAKRMPEGVDIKAALVRLQEDYSLRGVNLVRVASKWTFRTANDLSWLMTRESVETRRLSRAAIETLAIIAYHQPVTRAEIEEIRGVVTSKGTLDVLLETGWIRPRGRRKTPGRPLTFGTTEMFLSQFSLEALGDLPGLEELKGSGLLDTRLPTGFSVPSPSDDPQLREDEDPLEPGDLDLALAPPVEPEKDGES